MKRIAIFAFAAIIIAVLIYRFVERSGVTPARTISQIQAEEGYPVEVAVAVVKPFHVVRRYSGTVVGGEQGDAIPLIGEYIARVNVKEGDVVRQDQVICELSRDNPAAGYRRTELALKNAELELDRVRKLHEQGAVSRQMLDGLTLQRDLAQEGLAAAEKMLHVRAPISGTVTELTAEMGGWAAPGMTLAKIVSADRLRVQTQIPADDRDMIKMGASVRLSSGGAVAGGRVERVAGSADPDARSFTAWIEMSGKPEGYGFSPGLMVDAAVNVIDEGEALTIPPDALTKVGDCWCAYVIEERRAKVQRVDVGGRNADAVWIRSGLNAGDTIVVNGANLLYDGAPVRIVSAE